MVNSKNIKLIIMRLIDTVLHSADSSIYALHLTEKPNTSHHQQARLQSLALEIQALDRLYTLAGMAMDAKTAAKRQAYYEEYERLKQAVSFTCSYT